MSDQDTKPLEDSTVAAPVQSTEPKAEIEAAADAPTQGETAPEPAANTEEPTVKTEDEKPTTATEEATAKTEDEKPTATTEEETVKKTEDDQPAAPSTETNANKTTIVSVLHPPKNMLRVKREQAVLDGTVKANKFDPNVLQESSDPVQIRSQVHFYFSDSNLASDKFMREQTGGTENKAIPLATITSFKRMRRFQPYSAVVTALKESTFVVIEGDEGKETIRRQKAWDPTKNAKLEERSIYVKGFGNEIPSTQFDIEAFFTQHGEIHSVRLRRGDDGGFKGSVFVEWADQETAEKFMALDPKPTWKEHDLLIMWKAEYMKQKNDAIREGKIQPKNNHGKPFHRGRGRGAFRGSQRDGADANDWKKRREEDQKRGFGDRRDGRDQRGRGRGRGRGGRGRGDHRGGRGRDQAEEQQVKKEPVKATNENGELPAPKINISSDTATANGKRAREDEAGKDRPAKKVDTKEVAAETA